MARLDGKLNITSDLCERYAYNTGNTLIARLTHRRDTFGLPMYYNC